MLFKNSNITIIKFYKLKFIINSFYNIKIRKIKFSIKNIRKIYYRKKYYHYQINFIKRSLRIFFSLYKLQYKLHNFLKIIF